MKPSGHIGVVLFLLTPWFFVQSAPSMGYLAWLGLWGAPFWLVGCALTVWHTSRRGEAERALLGFAALGAFLCWLSDAPLMIAALTLAAAVLGSARTPRRLWLVPVVMLVPLAAVWEAYGVEESSYSRPDIPMESLIGQVTLLVVCAASFIVEGVRPDPRTHARPNP